MMREPWKSKTILVASREGCERTEKARAWEDLVTGRAGTTPPNPPFARGGKRRKGIGMKAQHVQDQLFTSPARRSTGRGGVVGQETGAWGEGAGAGRTGAGGTERSTPSDWQRKAMATCLVTFRPRIPHRAPSRKSQKLRATHATSPSKPANDI